MPPDIQKIYTKIDKEILVLLQTTEFEKKRGETTLDCSKCIKLHENMGIIQGLRKAQEIIDKEQWR
jgi:hypothetical protein